MGRTPLWTPRPSTARDVIAGAAWVSRYGPCLETERRVVANFKEFCSLSHLARENAYVPYVGQLCNAGLSAGTISQYVKFVTRGDHGDDAYCVRKASEASHADAVTKHAPDISTEQAIQVIRALETEEEDQACAVWMMLATGARPADLQRLRGEAVKVTLINGKRGVRVGSDLRVTWRWTKGIHKHSHRREMTYPLKALPSPPKRLSALLKNGPRPFTLSATALNKALKELADKPSTPPIPRMTCYSFRRLFCENCRVQGLDVKKMMMHAADTMVAAHYSFGRAE